MLIRKCLAILLTLAAVTAARAQLAITEAMSSASTNLETQLVLQNPDFWELTNFGTNDVDLNGYRWNDNAGGLIGADPTPFTGLMIAAGESIIFVESNATTVATTEQFREWWGATNLPPSLKVIFYSGNGLSSLGDGIRFWGPNAVNDSDVIDSVDFLEAQRGASFTYDSSTGVFGVVSTNGVEGAFKAATRDDVGSPGFTTGPVPLAITRQPTNISVNPGDTAVFTVQIRGLPRPTYQWLFNGANIDGARFSTLTIVNVQADKLGQYSVVVNNGFDSLTSSNATLSLNAAPEPPQFVLPLKNQSAFVGQPITFTTLASGVPEPTYQWQFNSNSIAGATGASYSIPSASLSDVGTYTVIASNPSGSVTNSAMLKVTRRPLLKITEVMSAQSTNGLFRGHNDWWELTNFDDFTVDLTGYRFDDGSATLLAAVTFTNNNLSIAPGESVVFVEGMTADDFRSWWGSANLPTNVQIVPYAAAGLSLSSLGDAINLWNSGASDDIDTIASEVFSTGTLGVSFGFNPDTQVFGDLSQVGVFGAWIAPENGDIGSPGFLRNASWPRVLGTKRQASGLEITFIAELGRTYSVRFKNGLDDATWLTANNFIATTNVATVTVSDALTAAQRIYKIALEP
jgi:hypothetical protein